MKGKKFELYVCDLMDSRIEMWQVSNNISAHPIITRTVAAVLDWARVWSPSDSDSCWYQLKFN